MATNTQDYTETSEGGPQRLADAAGGIAEQATSVAEQRASSTMTQVGDSLQQVARAVHDASENLRGDQPQIANLADTAAQQVERAAQYLREHDAREVVDAAQDFARRQPAVVVGAGLALGLLVGRALKSANGSGSGAYGASQWRGTSRSGSTDWYNERTYGTSSSYEASGGYGTSADYTGGAAASSTTEHTGDTEFASGSDLTEGTR